MSEPLAGKVALVTGAAGGIGSEICRELARRGAAVVVNDLAEADKTVEAVRDLGGRAAAALGDISSAADVDRIFSEAVASFGRVDVLVNNAAVQTWGPLLDLTEADWDRVIETNLKGTFLCTQRAGRLMKQHGWGRIINIGSGSNKVAFPRLVSYTASKGGIETFTKAAASELGEFGITVNCVAPGAIEIERTKLEAPDFAGTWAKVTPTGRVGRPSDVASAVCYLATEEAEFISGQTLQVDGGLFARAPWPYEDQA